MVFGIGKKKSNKGKQSNMPAQATAMPRGRLPEPPFTADDLPRGTGVPEPINDRHLPLPAPEPPKPISRGAKRSKYDSMPGKGQLPAHIAEHALPIPDTGGEHEDNEYASAPLFIKVDKYRNIVKNLKELKSYSLGLRDALDALADIEKELKNGIDITNRALDKFNTILGLLDSKLIHLQNDEDADIGLPKEIDDYVKNLHDQVDKIRSELRSVEDED